ncbi:hypothetical protein P4H65_21910 [Paenibacillus chitinolyticus]|uniref:hypothetical protein n=1 Tax=Paenibacillus chitinolyticus TaxID=79263 RepID=UPI002DBAE582|nr:hypothetical protein [Paenibacillus chitinolyticus]MEC0248463.1 hypothetical protein [Paenibacillus chitinolyticus]
MHQSAPRVHVHISPGREQCRGNPDSAERRELPVTPRRGTEQRKPPIGGFLSLSRTRSPHRPNARLRSSDPAIRLKEGRIKLRGSAQDVVMAYELSARCSASL